MTYGAYDTWKGGEGTLEALGIIQDTGFRSPRRETPRRIKPVNDGFDRIKTYFPDRNFGFTRNGVFIHASNIIEGKPREGAKVTYEIREDAKGKLGVNVKVR